MTTTTDNLADALRVYLADLTDNGAGFPGPLRAALAAYDAERAQRTATEARGPGPTIADALAAGMANASAAGDPIFGEYGVMPTPAREPAGAHTLEPWAIGFSDGTGQGYITAGDHPALRKPEESAAVVVSGGTDDWGVTHGVRRPEDARRIVACVNACAGIPTETLEGGRVVKVHTADHGDGAGTFERDLPPAVVMHTPHADVPMAAPGGDA